MNAAKSVGEFRPTLSLSANRLNTWLSQTAILGLIWGKQESVAGKRGSIGTYRAMNGKGENWAVPDKDVSSRAVFGFFFVQFCR